MIKCTDKQKLKAVKAYRKGRGGLLATARAEGVNVASLRKWVAGYNALGEAGVVTKRRRNYDPEFKLEVLRRMSEEGLSCNQAAALFNVRRLSQVAEWWQLYAAHGAAALQVDWKEEQTKMKEAPRQREKEEAQLTISEAGRNCYAMSSSFAWHCNLKTKIREIFDRHRGRYGYRRITAELKRNGWGVNHKTVQRLMIAMQLKSLVRPKRYKAFTGAVCETAPNHLQRDFAADRPNEKWVTDVTEFKVNNRKLYLSPVMDLYNREIVSYEVADRPLPIMIESMLTKAFGRLGPGEKPMLHSDQGWHDGFNRSSQHWVVEQISGTRSEPRQGSSNQALSEAWC